MTKTFAQCMLKKWTLVAAVMTISTVAANSQPGVRRPELPANLTTYVGEYPAKLMKVASVKSRLRSLLGKSYSDFNTSINVQHQIKRDGDFLFASGCMAHSCTTNEAAFVINLKTKRIHAAIYDKEAATQFFNEDKLPTPQILLDWIGEFDGT